MLWYTKTKEDLFQYLETSDKGLTAQEASARIAKYGLNQLALHKEPWWKLVIEPFNSVFVAVLGAAAVVSLLGDHVLDAAIIAAIILVNSAIFYTQQYATSRVLRSLRRHSLQTVRVLRDGQKIKISSLELVPGDIIFLDEGERVPADGRMVHIDNLQIDESALTGESVPIHKHVSTLDQGKQIYEQDNMVFQGTYVVSGSGQALIVETGANTEYGKIAVLAGTKKEKSPVQEKIDQLIAMLVKVLGIVAVIVFILSLARGIPTGEALRFVMSLSVSAVPEGLPVALTVIIVLGMRRMAKYNALVRSFKAIEDIGLITAIATDKTGTLTKNHLTVVDSWALKNDDITMMAGKTTTTTDEAVDPLEIALEEFTKHQKQNKPDNIYPFNLALRMSGAYYQSEKTLYIKGAPEHILQGSGLGKEEHHQAESTLHIFASKGYRVIAVAKHLLAKAPGDLKDIEGKKHDFIGFIAFADELRPEARQAILEARQAGIDVKLITGDHFETAYHIGSQVGLAEHRDQIIQGSELPENPDLLAEVIKNKTVFARILPEDKFKILQALKKNNITAMTGDGVNDVPALANAHVGIAMGSGSDIAKDAGGIVLLDDNFSTIIKALSEGRKIFDNIRRMLFYLLSTSLGEVMTMIGALLFGLPLPVTAIQILWINLVTDTAMVLPLGLEPAEDGHMQRPPRRPNQPLLGRVLLTRMVAVAMTMAVVTLFIVWLLNGRGYERPYIQTVAFMSLIAAQWMNAFNARSEYQSSFARIGRPNYGLMVGFTIAFTLQMIAMFGPLQSVLGIVSVNLNYLLYAVFSMAFAVLAVGELHKFWARRYLAANPTKE